MPELKLGKLPDRKPVKITITVSAALDKKLHSYAEATVPPIARTKRSTI